MTPVDKAKPCLLLTKSTLKVKKSAKNKFNKNGK